MREWKIGIKPENANIGHTYEVTKLTPSRGPQLIKVLVPRKWAQSDLSLSQNSPSILKLKKNKKQWINRELLELPRKIKDSTTPKCAPELSRCTPARIAQFRQELLNSDKNCSIPTRTAPKSLINYLKKIEFPCCQWSFKRMKFHAHLPSWIQRLVREREGQLSWPFTNTARSSWTQRPGQAALHECDQRPTNTKAKEVDPLRTRPGPWNYRGIALWPS